MFHFSGVDRAEFVELVATNGGSVMVNAYTTKLRRSQKLWRALLAWPELVATLDSGAYQGNTDIDGYCGLLDEVQERFLWYANLDVMGNSLETQRNYCEMVRRGYRPLWIHQPGGDLGLLHEMVQENGLVGLGGVVPILKRELAAAIRYLLEMGDAVGTAGGKAHVFGLTSARVLVAIAGREWFESADGQTWLVGYKAQELVSRDGRRWKSDDLGLALTRAECAANNIRVMNGWVNGAVRQVALF